MNRSFDSEYTVFFDMDDEDTLELELNPEQMRELAAAVAAHEATTQRAESEQKILPAALPAAFEEHQAQSPEVAAIQAPPVRAEPIETQSTQTSSIELEDVRLELIRTTSLQVATATWPISARPRAIQASGVQEPGAKSVQSPSAQPQPLESQPIQPEPSQGQPFRIEPTEVQPEEVSLAPIPVAPSSLAPPAQAEPRTAAQAAQAPSLPAPAIATGEPAFATGDNSPRRRMRVVAVAGVSGAVLVMGITAYLATIQPDESSSGATPSPSLSLAATTAPTELAAPAPAPAPTLAEAQPVLFTNPFDSQEVFEFPPGTSRIEARDAVAELLLQRARERHISMPQKIRANKKAADRASHVSKARELAQRN